MRQGWKHLPLCAALALGALLIPLADIAPAGAARSATPPAPRTRATLHQFTGVVTAIDKNSLTVEKQGKTPRTIQFTKHPEMSTTGSVEKDARVTVWYRDEDGRPTAHRVVARQQRTSGGQRTSSGR